MKTDERQKSFPLHSRVLLKSCPYGPPGVVVKIERCKAVVLWTDLGGPPYTGRHSPDRLMLADVRKEPL
jgi:hypothetical protein